MIHWLVNAFRVYFLHVEHGNGYLWWSSVGGRSLGVGALAAFWWHRHNCHEDGCWRMVRHGKTHCPKHETKNRTTP